MKSFSFDKDPFLKAGLVFFSYFSVGETQVQAPPEHSKPRITWHSIDEVQTAALIFLMSQFKELVDQ